jgi:PBP1b-binding outer membrane lipoprotein LpoB
MKRLAALILIAQVLVACGGPGEYKAVSPAPGAKVEGKTSAGVEAYDAQVGP